MRYRRSRTGCLTCRSRRKKCDEVRPRCAGCRRNQLPCDWPTQSSSERHSRPKDSTTASTVAINDCCPFKSPVISARASILQRSNFSAPTIAPPVSSIWRGATSQDQRACLLTPQSVTLLSHFLMHTAASFATGPANDNPFVTLLVPLASTDDLLMHALLAVSGTQLGSKDPNLPISVDFSRAARLHYSRLISGLLEELSGLAEDDLDKKERLLRLLMVACHYEVGPSFAAVHTTLDTNVVSRQRLYRATPMEPSSAISVLVVTSSPHSSVAEAKQTTSGTLTRTTALSASASSFTPTS